MKLIRKMRFTMASAMMLVVTAAVASALFAKVREVVPAANQPYLRIDAPILFIAAIALTAIGLGALKAHSAGQTMFQIVLACLGFLFLLTMAQAKWERPLLYWFQSSFAVLATGPMLARRVVKSEMERGPRREWWKRTFEAIFFSFLTMMLVFVGIFMQWFGALLIGANVLKF